MRTLTGPLAADGVRGALRLDVPHGRDTLGQVLADGVVITKKGTLFDASRFEGRDNVLRRLIPAAEFTLASLEPLDGRR